MPYNFADDSFHTKKLCSRLSSSEVHFLIKIGRFAFLRPPLRNIGATYGDHLRLIGKRVVDFLLALIELFSIGVTAEALRAIRRTYRQTDGQTDRQTDGQNSHHNTASALHAAR